jgi:ATPase subunit of ABC transporter with duplicated ATPase domains
LESYTRVGACTEEKARADCGLRGADATKPTASLSGGQRARLALALAVASGADLLPLDEPANHLDADWKGTAPFVSHDRRFVEAEANAAWLLRDGALEATHLDRGAEAPRQKGRPSQSPISFPTKDYQLDRIENGT